MEAIADWFIHKHRRVLSWLQDDVFRHLFINAGKLLSANAIAAVLGLVATVLTARALGPEQYGVLALVLVYQLTVGKLVTFNAWQAVIPLTWWSGSLDPYAAVCFTRKSR